MHSKEYEHARRKLGIKKDAPVGALMEKSQSMIGKSFPRKPKPQGKGIVKALGQKKTTGNFKKIEAAKGKGAAIGALVNKYDKVHGKKPRYTGKK